MQHPITNNTKQPMYVGGLLIPPGETRHVEMHHLPADQRPAVAKEEEAPAGDPLAELLAGNVKEALAAIPGLSDADLELLGEKEQVGKARSTLLAAIAEAILTRANANLSDDKKDASPNTGEAGQGNGTGGDQQPGTGAENGSGNG